LDVPSIPTAHQVEMVGNLGDRLEAYLKNEAQNNQQQTSDM
jgi:hypothetical protein